MPPVLEFGAVADRGDDESRGLRADAFDFGEALTLDCKSSAPK
jgi:hypothetical protein